MRASENRLSESERQVRSVLRSRARRRAVARLTDQHRDEYSRYYDEEIDRLLAEAGLSRLRLWSQD